jgi:hypothetical protein
MNQSFNLEQIKWLCDDIYITDRQILNLDFKPKKELLNGGSYGYSIRGKFKSNKWIEENKVSIKNYITD